MTLTEDEWLEIQEEVEEDSWSFANNVQLRLCQSVLNRIDQAQEERKPFDEFKAELVEWFP